MAAGKAAGRFVVSERWSQTMMLWNKAPVCLRIRRWDPHQVTCSHVPFNIPNKNISVDIEIAPIAQGNGATSQDARNVRGFWECEIRVSHSVMNLPGEEMQMVAGKCYAGQVKLTQGSQLGQGTSNA